MNTKVIVFSIFRLFDCRIPSEEIIFKCICTCESFTRSIGVLINKLERNAQLDFLMVLHRRRRQSFHTTCFVGLSMSVIYECVVDIQLTRKYR